MTRSKEGSCNDVDESQVNLNLGGNEEDCGLININDTSRLQRGGNHDGGCCIILFWLCKGMSER